MTDTPPSDPQPTTSVDRSSPTVDELVSLYARDAVRGDRVQRLAAELFEAVPTAHGLPAAAADVVRATARLCDVGHDGPAPAEALIAQRGIAGFNGDGVALVVRAVALVRHRSPTLPDGERAAASCGLADRVAGLVSVADALAGVGPPTTRVINVDDTRSVIRVTMRGPTGEAADSTGLADAFARSAVLCRQLRFLADEGSRYYVRPGDTMGAVAHKVFARLHRDAMSRRDGVRRDAHIEELHKFRVATRRLRAALRAFRPVFGRELLREATTSARAVARATNGARDLDVFLQCFQGESSLARIPTLLARIRLDRERAMDATLSVVHGAAFDSHRRAMDRLHAETHPRGRSGAGRRRLRKARKEAPRMVRRRLRRVMDHGRDLAAADDLRRHDLRIAAKQLRYVLEFFADVLPADTAELITKMKAMQDSLGDANDCAVQTAYVTATGLDGGAMVDAPEVERVATQSLVAELESRRQRALELFRAQWTEFTDEADRRLQAAEPTP